MGRTVSHTEESFSCARSNARWVFRGAIYFKFSNVSVSSFAFSLDEASSRENRLTAGAIDSWSALQGEM